jgi:S-formylglutathione hydrolase FrmB
VGDKWAANAPLVMVDQYVPNLKRLHAIALEIGTHDSLLSGVQALHDAMTADGIAHTYETYDGDHVNRIESRFESRTLPFFAKNLSFGSGTKVKKGVIDQGSQPEPKPKAPE